MKSERISLVQRLAEEERERLGDQPPPLPVPPEIQHTQLPEDHSGGPLAREWNVYRREIGRLLAEGQEGRFILIKGEDVLGLFDSWDAARAAGLKRFLREPFFVHPIRASEPHLRIRGITQPWPNFASPPPEQA
jgi:hypothetical protein